MDVVKSTFEKLGGAIDLETNIGKGTKVIIHLPTTLTIMSSLIVRIEGDRYAVPHSELKEVILVRPEDEIKLKRFVNGKSIAYAVLLSRFFQWRKLPEFPKGKRQAVKQLAEMERYSF
jgi:chemotaxis protein histidine kinase CheA